MIIIVFAHFVKTMINIVLKLVVPTILLASACTKTEEQPGEQHSTATSPETAIAEPNRTAWEPSADDEALYSQRF